ncbi:unnamed protein product [Pylaiella littoralis]
MRGFRAKRGVTATRAIEELSVLIHAKGGGDDQINGNNLPRIRGGLFSNYIVRSCCCSCSSSSANTATTTTSSSSSNTSSNTSRSRSTSRSSCSSRGCTSSSKVGGKQRRDCGCCCFFYRRLASLFTRKRTRQQSGALVLLFLAAAFSLRGWRAAMMIESRPFGVGRWSTSSADEFYKQQQLWRKDEERGGSGQCEWKPNGPVLFNLQHSQLHADASHWFHVAECFIGRRSEFLEFFSGMDETDVYVKDSDRTWNSKLTPMTRLLLIAGLTSVGARAVHFVDGNHASFSFPYSSKYEIYREGTTGGLRGGKDQGAVPPLPGQVGLLRLDDVGHKSQFIVSTEQPLPHRLEVSAPVSPARPWDGRGYAGGVSNGGGRDGVVTQECVKFARNVGSWGQKRPKWFPGEGDSRELLRALDNFCPIPWLRKEEKDKEGLAADDGDEDIPISPSPGSSGRGNQGGGGRFSRGLYGRVVGRSGRARGRGAGRGGLGFAAGAKHSMAEPKKLIIYQRDRNRRLLKADELADELWIRLGHIGWTVTEIFHDSERHPCDLIAEVADADVLLTAHGFQSMLSLFMPPGSVLFEVYPNKYFKEGYAPMARRLGLRYGFSESPPMLPFTSWKWPSVETCMSWRLCRGYVRKSDVVIHDDGFESLISLMLQSSRAR